MFMYTVPSSRKQVAQKLSTDNEWSYYWKLKRKLKKSNLSKSNFLKFSKIVQNYQKRMLPIGG